MAPNHKVKPVLNRRKFTDANGHSNVVRTEFVVKNIYVHLLEDEYVVQSIPAQNAVEEAAIEAFKDVVDMFKTSYAMKMAAISSSLDVTSETMSSVMLGVSNELFCEGINWSRIATFFAFTSELSLQCLRKNFPESVIEEALDCCLKFVQDCLQKWIDDHNGWEGIIEFSSRRNEAVQQPLQHSDSGAKSAGWAKNAIYGTVRVLGTLAHIANFADPTLSFP